MYRLVYGPSLAVENALAAEAGVSALATTISITIKCHRAIHDLGETLHKVAQALTRFIYLQR